MRRSIKRLAMVVLWPSFLAAAVAEGAFFSLFEPDHLWAVPQMAAYTIGCFCFWTMCALASLLTYYLIAEPAVAEGPT